MIYIEQNQVISENSNLKVASATGDYADGALIEFYDIAKPETIAGSFQAQYVKYGGLVYRFNEPKELGAAILAIDADSTHTSASYVRMMRELDSQMSDGSLEPASLDQVVTDEQASMKDKAANIDVSDPSTAGKTEATTTQQTATPAQETATTTPATSTEHNQTASAADAFDATSTSTSPIDVSPGAADTTSSTTPTTATSTPDTIVNTQLETATSTISDTNFSATSTPATPPAVPDILTPPSDITIPSSVDDAVAASTTP